MTSIPEAMSHHHEHSQAEGKQPCHDWPLGKCPHGTSCRREHHRNLDPALRSTREHDFDVSNAVGEACVGCVQAVRECDKKGRHGDDDPCSECRWFGGESCKCFLAADTSYNDQLFKQMLVRGRYDYTLADNKSRDAPRGHKKVTPAPMPNHRIKPDWTGETRERLLAKPDMLPAFVRALPRAYLVPPRQSSNEKKTESFKRKREAGFDVSSPTPMAYAPYTAVPSLPRFPAPLSIPRPIADTQNGEVVVTSWNWTERRWEHTYANGAKAIGPTWNTTYH